MFDWVIKGRSFTFKPSRPGPLCLRVVPGARADARPGFTNPSGVVSSLNIADAKQHVCADLRRRPIQADRRI